jgi:hypothetical protein
MASKVAEGQPMGFGSMADRGAVGRMAQAARIWNR